MAKPATAAAEQLPKAKKTFWLWLIPLLLLAAAGISYFTLKNKEDRGAADSPPPNREGLGGRSDPGPPSLSEEEQLKNLGLDKERPESQAPPVYADSEEGKRLTEQRAEKLQMNETTANWIRSNYKVGRSMVENQVFKPQAVEAIKSMFGQIQGVDPEKYWTYPIYGRWETGGQQLRNELENYKKHPWDEFNLTDNRTKTSDWFINSLTLNLLMGNRENYTPNAWQIRVEQAKHRQGLDFYKKVNNHNVKDDRLISEFKSDGRAMFAAGGVSKLVDYWIKAIDYYDKVTLMAAKEALINEGVLTDRKDSKDSKDSGEDDNDSTNRKRNKMR